MLCMRYNGIIHIFVMTSNNFIRSIGWRKDISRISYTTTRDMLISGTSLRTIVSGSFGCITTPLVGSTRNGSSRQQAWNCVKCRPMWTMWRLLPHMITTPLMTLELVLGHMFSLHWFLIAWLVSYPFVPGFVIVVLFCFLTYMESFRVPMFEDLWMR
jgi:hypothetical protein